MEKPSMTAMVTAFARAYHALNEDPKIFDDRLARELFSDGEYEGIAAQMAQGIAFFNPERPDAPDDPEDALSRVMQTQLGPTTLSRSRYAEDALNNALKLGTKQYVILGAGWDTFAFRHPQAGVEVFEVDRPESQRDKVRRIAGLGWEPHKRLHFAPCDLASENLAGPLLRSGFDPGRLSFFSLLGVTYYLTPEENMRVFEAIAYIAPKGSAVAFDYADGDVFDEAKTSRRVQNMVALAKESGEPMRSGFSREALESVLDKAGLLITEHLSPAAIEKRFFAGRKDAYHAFENISYALAVVQ
ncbi:MAG: class I SAM-dependent methyltransferase [Christensenellales bacterium]